MLNVTVKKSVFLFALLLGGLFLSASSVVEAQSNDPLVYPQNGQILEYGESYMIRARSIPGATHYLVWMRQGNTIYENWADNGSWSRDLVLSPSHSKHGLFERGKVEIGARGWVPGSGWTSQGTISVTLSGGKTSLRHDFSLSHGGPLNLGTEVPLSCWTVVHGNPNQHLCRYVEGSDHDQYYTFGKNRALETSWHPTHGSIVIADWGKTYEGCVLKSSTYWCDYKTYGHFDLNTYDNDRYTLGVFYDWGRYQLTNASCIVGISGLWRSGRTSKIGWGILLNDCANGPM